MGIQLLLSNTFCLKSRLDYHLKEHLSSLFIKKYSVQL